MPNALSPTDVRALHKAGYSSYAGKFEITGDTLEAFEGKPTDTRLVPVASLTTTASVLYARYLGRATGRKLDKIALVTSGSPSVTVVTTVGFATSAAAPDFAAVSLTIKTSNAVPTTGSAGAKSVSSINYTPAVGEHVWVYSQHTATGTQPTVWAHGGELGQGVLVQKASQPLAPAVGTAITGALIAAAVTAQNPLLWVA